MRGLHAVRELIGPRTARNAAPACSCGCDGLVMDVDLVRDADGLPFHREHLPLVTRMFEAVS